MLTRFRAGAVVAAAGAALALAGAGLALAHDASFPSRVTINHVGPGDYRGAVVSEKHACEVGRTVKFIQPQPGPDAVRVVTTTNSEGRWRVLLVGYTYYAVVTKRVLTPPGGHQHVCQADRSPTVEGD
jgi:hypothetical protein